MRLTAVELSDGWQLAHTPPNQCQGPDELDGLQWIPSSAPGTAASALRAAGAWQPGDPLDFDSLDWWFRTRFTAEPAGPGEELWLALDGIATVHEVYLNGERVLTGDSMFAAHELEVSRRLRTGPAENELVIACRALGPLLGVSRRPRARWRTRLVSSGNLRFYRTMLLGRAPGFAPGPACVGPWKPVWLERRRGVVVEELRLRTRVEGSDGTLSVRGRLRPTSGGSSVEHVAVELSGPSGTHRTPLAITGRPDGLAIEGELVVPGVERWWPHTHGTPALHEVRLVVGAGREELTVPAGRVGFRDLRIAGALEPDGLQLRVNDVPVFARGAVWTPLDLAAPGSRAPAVASVLGAVAQAGMNMLRVPGVGCYENDAFYDLCDELGILVWQDFMFANLDYPEQDAEFMDTVAREARGVLAALGWRPSLAVLCGGSETAQQVAMLGLDPGLASGPLFGELLPALVAEAEVRAPYVPSTPWGGDLPFRTDRGVAHYYGVGAYRRPLEDARRAEVKFAAEALALANVPDGESLEAAGGLTLQHPRWKAGVPRDVGAEWDFEDVRDHYLRLLYELDPVALRRTDPDRYLELSRHVSGEVITEVMGEWRREASPCGGALVLCLNDLVAGPGWGVLDSEHRPKVAYHYLRRALAPVAVWSVDEGLGGIVAHVANDRPEPLRARLRVALYRDCEVRVEEVVCEVALGPHSSRADNVEELLGRFVDVSWSYRFGPPAQDAVVLSLETAEEERLLSQAFRFPAGRPTRSQTADELGLCAKLHKLSDNSATVSVATRRLAYGVRVRVPGFVADDDAFSVEPGHARVLGLRPVAGPGREAGDAPPAAAAHVTAVNLAGRLAISRETGG